MGKGLDGGMWDEFRGGLEGVCVWLLSLFSCALFISVTDCVHL